MAELRRTLAGVAPATSPRKVPKGSLGTKSAHFDWPILAADFATLALGLYTLRPAFQMFDWAGLGTWAAVPSGVVPSPGPAITLALALAGAAAAVWYFWFRGHYLRRRSSWDRLGDLALISGCLVVAEALATWQGLSGGLPLPAIVLMWTLVGGLVLAARLGLRRHLEQRGAWRRPAVILGSGPQARTVAGAGAEDEDLGLSVTHILQISELASEHEVETTTIAGREVSVVTTQDPLASLFLRFRDHVILIAPPPEQLAAVDRLVPTLTSLCPTVGVALPAAGLAVEGAATQVLLKRDVVLVWMQNRLMRPEWRALKRCFDVLASAGILIVTSPMLLAVAVLVRCLDGAPVFVAQERVGRNGRIFRMIKFRTMVKAAGKVLAPQVTPLGRLLRQTGIEKLPQLWNALRGDMSFVGPQPLLRRELGDYGDNILLYLTARPGLSGLWQVSGQSESQFSDRAQLDGWYVHNWSFWYDIVILFRTVRMALGRSGAW